MHAYTVDNEEYMPYPSHVNNLGFRAREAWAYNISPYLGRDGWASITGPIERRGDAYSRDYLRCPEQVDIPPGLFSIGAHFAWSTATVPWHLSFSRRIDTLPDMFVISDANASTFTSPKYYPYATHWGPASIEDYPGEWRHMDTHNFAYLDGRVEQYSRQWFLDHPQKLPSDF